MDLQNTKTNDEGKELLNHGKTLRLHTGNLVNRSRLKKKCPGSPSEEVREESQKNLLSHYLAY